MPDGRHDVGNLLDRDGATVEGVEALADGAWSGGGGKEQGRLEEGR